MDSYGSVRRTSNGSRSPEVEMELSSSPSEEHLSSKSSTDLISDEPGMESSSSKWRNLSAFWLLGLCNNYSYVIMLSAAHDILSKDFHGNSTDVLPSNHSNSTRDCNPTSTGAILLADILPSLAIKIVAPFMFTNVHIRSVLVIGMCTLSFLLVALSVSQWMAFLGVICAALCGGLGEVTYLSYSSQYSRNVISTWSSGTGASGVLGSLSYAALTSEGVGLSPRNTLFVMLVVPVFMAFSFWILLEHPGSKYTCCKAGSASSPLVPVIPTTEHAPGLSLHTKIRIVPKLMKYMVPLGLVYLFEYFINQGLMELINFHGIWLKPEEQYRWLQVDYQVGVFLSRSSVNLFTIKKTWVLALLQALNVVLFTTEAVYLFLPSIWYVLALVLWEGLLGGAAYVNTFYRISQESPEEEKSFSMGVASLGDAVGIALAGAISLPAHNALCQLPPRI